MGKKIASLWAEIGADTTKLKSGLDEAKTKLGGFASSLKSVGGALAAAGVFVAIEEGLRASVKEAIDAERALAQTEAVIKSTGGAAGVSGAMVTKLADQYGRLAGMDDDVIRSGENVLLTFRSIGKDVFPQATKAVLDMAIAMAKGDTANIDLQGTAIQVGKALESPVAGMAALQRVGVMFTVQQKEQIKNFVAMNDLASAQGIILGELQKEFGGMAEAMGGTNAGKIERARESFKKLGETVGGFVLPIIGKLAETVDGALNVSANFDKNVIAETVVQHGKDVLKTSASYEEYSKELERAAGVAAYAVKANGDLVDKNGELISSNYRLAASAYDDIKAFEARNAGLKNVTLTQAQAYEQEQQALSDFSNKQDGLTFAYEKNQAAIAANSAALAAYEDAMASVADEQANLSKVQGDYLAKEGAGVVQIMGQGMYEGSKLYKEGLQAVDDVLGTTYKAEYDHTEGVKALVLEYSRTGNMEKFKEGLSDIKAEMPKTTSELDKAQGAAARFKKELMDILTLNGMTVTFHGELITGVEGGSKSGPKPTGDARTGAGKSQGIGGAWGLEYTVPAGYTNDSYPVRAQTGEHVSITPVGGESGNKLTVYGNLSLQMPNNGTLSTLMASMQGAA